MSKEHYSLVDETVQTYQQWNVKYNYGNYYGSNYSKLNAIVGQSAWLNRAKVVIWILIVSIFMWNGLEQTGVTQVEKLHVLGAVFGLSNKF